MAQVLIEAHGSVALIRLNRGVTNAIGPEMVEELLSGFDEITSNYRGLVLAGGTKFFSIGLDLPQLLTLSKPRMTEFWVRFNDMVLALCTLPVPTVCAMRGHAIAAGTILSLACDFRYAVTQEKLMGLNEVKLGLPVPYLADLMLRQLVDDRIATPMVYEGDFIKLPDARRQGLIDETTTAAALEARALNRVSKIAALTTTAFAETKANRVELIQERFAQHSQSKNTAFLACWFSPETQTLLKKAAKTF